MNPKSTRALIWGMFFLLLLIPLGLALFTQQTNWEMDQAQQAAANGDWQTAAQHMAAAARMAPGQSRLWETAGHYALRSQDVAAALQYLEQAGQENLTSQGWSDLGQALLQNGDRAAAIATWEKALQTNPDSAALWSQLWQAQRDSGDYPAAIASLQKLAVLQPGEAQTSLELGLLQAAIQPETALETLQTAAQAPRLSPSAEKVRQAILAASLQGDPAYVLLESGRALAAIERWELAAAAFRQATQISPSYAAAWAYLGEARQHLPGEADLQTSTTGLVEIQTALQIDPASLPAHLCLSYYWTRRQDFERAAESLQQAIRLYPQDPALQAELGNVLAQAGKLFEAYQAYTRAIDSAPNDPAYLRHLIRFSLNYGYEVEGVALPASRQAVILAPRQAETLDLAAQTMLKLGDLSNAERYLERALQADPDYAPAHLHLGIVALLRGQMDLARQRLQWAASLDPGSATAEQVTRLMETYFP